jgi:hypothetical protein
MAPHGDPDGSLRRQKSQNLPHHAISLIGLKEKLSVRSAV